MAEDNNLCGNTYTSEYSPTEPCEQTSTDCVTYEGSISEFSLNDNPNLTLIINSIVSSLISLNAIVVNAVKNLFSNNAAVDVEGTIQLDTSIDNQYMNLINATSITSVTLPIIDKTKRVKLIVTTENGTEGLTLPVSWITVGKFEPSEENILSIDVTNNSTNGVVVSAVIENSRKDLKEHTVATLPTGTEGQIAYVTDADTISYRATAVGGGIEKALVFFDGTNWIYH